MFILVKGKPQFAVKCAVERGFRVKRVKTFDLLRDTVSLYVDGKVEDLVRWFTEHETVIEGYGYPNGTLLHYNEENLDG